ncbi:MAG: hypothetical protein WD049_01415 [Candidatus Paceibacterota bacterium]
MTALIIPALEPAIHKTNVWLEELAEEMNGDYHHAYQGLRCREQQGERREGRILDRGEREGRFFDRREGDDGGVGRGERDGRLRDRAEREGGFRDRGEREGRLRDREARERRLLNREASGGEEDEH